MMNKKELKKWQKQRDVEWGHISELIHSAKNHPNHFNCKFCVDVTYQDDYYEIGTILKISPNREGFDELYDLGYGSHFRGGLLEIKVGDNYVIYGHDFD